VDSVRRQRKLAQQETGGARASVTRKLVRKVVAREMRMIGRIVPVAIMRMRGGVTVMRMRNRIQSNSDQEHPKHKRKNEGQPLHCRELIPTEAGTNGRCDDGRQE
jgi:hypothetical protein